jgi:hypothetical protein
MRGLIVLGIVMLMAATAGEAQEPPKKVHDSTNPLKCKICQKPLLAAYQYLEKQGAGSDGFGQFFQGWLYLADNSHPKELQHAVSTLSSGFYKQGGFNGNWSTCMAALFLAEMYRREPTEKLRATLLDILKVAEANMEPSGGWCHHLGMASQTGYNKMGGGVDLGILTSMMYAAMLEMKKAGIPVPNPMLASVEKNLESLSDGAGVAYGTDNRYGDVAMGRGAYLWLGLHATQLTSSRFSASVPKGLDQRYTKTDQGHAYPPLHFTSVALAMHLLGPQTYQKFFDHWADRLIALQKPDGSIELPHVEGVAFQKQTNYIGSTAAFALVLILQQPGALEKTLPKEKKKPVGALFPPKPTESGEKKPADK